MNGQVIFDMYAKIEMGDNAICKCCKKTYVNLSRPVSIWQVRTKYKNSKYKLLFVGKNARGNPGHEKGVFLDSTICVEDLFYHKRWGVLELHQGNMRNVLQWRGLGANCVYKYGKM